MASNRDLSTDSRLSQIPLLSMLQRLRPPPILPLLPSRSRKPSFTISTSGAANRRGWRKNLKNGQPKNASALGKCHLAKHKPGNTPAQVEAALDAEYGMDL